MPEDTGFLGTLGNIARKIFNIPTQGGVEAGIGYERPVPKGYEEYDKEALRRSREAEIKDVRDMARTDARAFRIFYKLSSDAIVGGCVVDVTEAATESEKAKAQKIIDDLWYDCKIPRYLKGWISSCLKNGDLYLENIVDDSMKKIVRLKRLDAYTMRSNMNAEGNFPEDKDPYYQVEPLTERELVTFKPWQITQISWDREQGEKSGHPLLSSARLSWKRLDSGEKNVVIRRGIKSGSTRHHKIGTETLPGTPDMIREYKNMNKDALNDPLAAQTDIYSNGLVTIEELRGDTTLDQMADIEYFEGMIAMAAGVPLAFLGGGRERNINRDVLEEQEEDYYRVISDINDIVEEGFRQVIDFAFWLAGINDEAITYTFTWGVKDRDDFDSKIDRGLKLQQLGFDFQTIFEMIRPEGVTFEEVVERIRKQKEENIIPYGASMKVDPIIAAMIAGQAGVGKMTPEMTEQLQGLANSLDAYLNGISGKINLPGYDYEEVDPKWMLSITK